MASPRSLLHRASEGTPPRRSRKAEGGPERVAPELARLAWRADIRGFVCSAHECGSLRADLGPEAFLVTPGIRPEHADAGDQKRVMTPTSAIMAGANLLVLGRPIRDAKEPAQAAAAIAREVEQALRR